ncbi:MAG: type III polyketide synthase [Bacteroidota bacterium]
MPTYINHIGTATPTHNVAQEDIAHFMMEAQEMDEAERRKLRILYRASGIRQRQSILADYGRKNGAFEFFPNTKGLEPFPTVGDRMRTYEAEALPLALRAIRATGGSKAQIDQTTHLITVSCTGMYAPGLDIELVEHLGLSPSVQRTAINFMGCYAAFVAIKMADQICRANAKAKVLVVCVELCTLHFQKEKSDDCLLANALFGDGAAALLVSNQQTEGVNLSLQQFHNDLAFQGKQEMAWQIGDFGFDMRLSAMVPEFIRAGIGKLSRNLLDHLNLNMSDIDFFAIHPGGKKILGVIEAALDLSQADNEPAYTVLQKHGNMSSPTVLFVLAKIMQQLSHADNHKNILSFAFGPGLTLESMLLGVAVQTSASVSVEKHQTKTAKQS